MPRKQIYLVIGLFILVIIIVNWEKWFTAKPVSTTPDNDKPNTRQSKIGTGTGSSSKYIISCPGKDGDKSCETWSCVKWNALKCKLGVW